MPSPVGVFDRDNEWDRLHAFATGGGDVTRIAVVYGRRRMGKSFLLRQLVEECGGFYDQALEQEAKPARDRIASIWAQERGLPPGSAPNFTEWEVALRAVFDNPNVDRPRLVVLDEFPYLDATSPELQSVIQLITDDARARPSPRSATRLVLCGSALSVMTKMIDGNAPLRGRAMLEMAVQPFDYRMAADYWGLTGQPDVAFNLDAVLGGTPGYRDLLETVGVPASVDELGEWLGAGVLEPGHALFREDEYLIAEDRSLGDRALYQSIITAIANGEVTVTNIAASVGRAASAMARPLKALERAGFIIGRPDMLKDRRPLYELTDPIVRFHHAVTRPDIARFEARDTTTAWAAADDRFRTHVLGPHFENVARAWTAHFASQDTTAGPVTQTGHARVSCREHKFEHELDVVTLNGNTVTLIGEAKYTAKERTVGDLNRLGHIRDLVGQSTKTPIKLAVYAGRGGFHQDLIDVGASRGDVELVDLDRLYYGS